MRQVCKGRVAHIVKSIELDPSNKTYAIYLDKININSDNDLNPNVCQVVQGSILNDASGSASGILWVSPWGGKPESYSNASCVSILSVDSLKTFKGVKSELSQNATYAVKKVLFDDKRGWLRIGLDSNLVIAKGAIRFYLLGDVGDVG